MDFVYPEGFLIEGVEPQSEAQEKADKKDNNFLLFFYINNIEGGHIHQGA